MEKEVSSNSYFSSTISAQPYGERFWWQPSGVFLGNTGNYSRISVSMSEVISGKISYHWIDAWI